ncbi:MAG: amino acid adenylation domain-containing protein [Betaproteobacteria bacterium]|nr:amino acid adenylation domain-containing protein [Betaproteobacteria bacterium]
MTVTGLHGYFIAAAERHADRTAVVEPGCGSVTYAELATLAARVRNCLTALGARPGDRIGICMRKSIDTVAAIYGILEAGCAYVPVDPGAPAARSGFIMHDCGVKAVVVEAGLQDALLAEIEALGSRPQALAVARPGGGDGLERALAGGELGAPKDIVAAEPDDLAYILYTSGSTGKPKGVMLSHDNAVSFVDWCSEVFQPTEHDRFSSHAPFHFDLSILDIHVALKHGATLVLVSEDTGKDPVRLAELIASERISIWYSAPSILSLLAQYGALEGRDYSSLRQVFFAGEVFPVKHLRLLCKLLPKPRYFNLYGPTETNVCTFYEVSTPIPDDREIPYPIGRPCSHLRARVVGESGADVERGQEGELCIAGRGVMRGYWNLADQTAKGFLTDASGTAWYRTGDVVVEAADGNYTYKGRRDRMVKRRGYRVELGEIEAGLYRHPAIKEAAVVASPDEEAGVKITAFLSCREPKHPSLIEMKRFCSQQLPLYMIPDAFAWQEALPKTSTDKIDYQRLKQMSG